MNPWRGRSGMTPAVCLVLLAGMALAEPPRVTFIPPPGATQLAVSAAGQARIRTVLRDTFTELERLSDVPARPVEVQVFATVEEYVTHTQVPPDFGAVTLDDIILLQPVAILDHGRRLQRLLEHEAVHHHFYEVGRWWPRNFHEALAHYLSGGKAVKSPRAAELAGKRRTGAEELEFECHLAWLLSRRIEPVGTRAFLRSLLRGEVNLDEFRRRSFWYPRAT